MTDPIRRCRRTGVRALPLLLVLLAVPLLACGVDYHPSPGQAAPNATSIPTDDLTVAADYNTCHYRTSPESKGDPLLVLPDPACTPGAYSPLPASQACAKEPPRPDLSQLKLRSLVRYGKALNLNQARKLVSRFEGDHFVMRWAGGLDGTSNYWPEPGASPNPKDGLEWKLRSLACSGHYEAGLTLDQQVQKARVDIEKDWVALYVRLGRPRAQPA